MLLDDNGVECRIQEDMSIIARDYFINLFQKKHGSRNAVFNALTQSVTSDDNQKLTSPFTIEEYKDAVFSMKADKCPGSDGFNPGFYQHFWDMCCPDILTAGSSWLDTGAFPPNLNSTNIALIPKGESQTSMKDWRSIALCNILYKVVAKFSQIG
jgi:hypothetical protein